MSPRFLICVVIAGLSLGTPALAAPPPGPRSAAPPAPPKNKDRADELFDQGTAAVDAGRLAEAEAKFAEAWSLKQTHDIAGNLGIIEHHLGKHRAAAEHLAWALQHMPPTESSATRKGLEQELEKARAEVGAVRVRVNVEGAAITLNGRDAGASPLAAEVFVEAGTVSVTVRREGYATAEQSVAVAKGATREVVIALVAAAKPAGRSLVPAVVMGSVGGAALLGGVVLMGVAESKRSEMASLTADTKHSCVVGDPAPQGACAKLASVASNAKRLGDIGIGGAVIGGLAAAGVVTYLLWPEPRGEAGPVHAVRVLPVAMAGGGGLVVWGSF
jgi:hypothetical protein